MGRWEPPNAEPKNSEPEGSHRPVAFLSSSLPLLALRSLSRLRERCFAIQSYHGGTRLPRAAYALPRHGTNCGSQLGRILSGQRDNGEDMVEKWKKKKKK